MKKYLKISVFLLFIMSVLLITSCKKSYKVTYNADGGTFSSGSTTLVEEYKKGETANLTSEVPTKNGYKFNGWKNSETGSTVTGSFTVEKNVTLVALWEEVSGKYKVTYDADGGKFSSGKSTLVEEYDQFATANITSEVPTKDGYIFNGWKNSETGSTVTGSFTVEKDMTLVAVWTLGNAGIKVTYKTTSSGKFSDGSTEKVIYVEKGSKFSYLELPTPNNASRAFTGWFDENGEYVIEGSTVTEDLVVSAKYRTPGEAFTVTYILNGGTSNLPEVDTYYKGINYQMAIPTKEGFEFMGWYDNEELTGDAVLYQDDKYTGDKVYYASWVIIDKKYANVIFDELLPSELDKSIVLPTSYQGATLRWKTSNYEYMKVTGDINQSHKNVTVTMSVDMVVDGETLYFERDVTIKAIVFDELVNPVAGYFYVTNVTYKTDSLMNNLDIVYYAFAGVSSSGSVSIENITYFNKLVSELNYLRQNGIRVVLSINGGNGGAANFSKACLNGGYAKVADNIVDLVIKYHLDGVDVDWEFPSDGTDMANMVSLCQSIKTKLAAHADGNGSPYIVTSAIPSSQLYTRFNLKALNDCLDFVNMMSYDMNLEGRTTHLCPLFKANNDGNVGYGIDVGVEWFTQAGLDKNKIIIGAAFYGKAYNVTGEGVRPNYPGLGAIAEAAKLQSGYGSTVTYNWIYRNVLTDKKWVRYYDTDAQVPYLYNESTKQFITYEDEESLIAKVNYAYQEGLGIMFWAYGYDYENTLTHAICDRMGELRG